MISLDGLLRMKSKKRAAPPEERRQRTHWRDWVNTPLGKHAQWDDYTLRQAAIRQRIAYTTTMSAESAA